MPEPMKWELTESQKILLDVVLSRQRQEVMELVSLFARELKVDPDVKNTLEEVITNRAFTKEASDEKVAAGPDPAV